MTSADAALRAYVAGLAGVGLVVGLYSGLSLSPVATVVIVSVFGLIGGSSGLYLARTHLDIEEHRARLRAVGWGLCALCLTCTTATIGAVKLRGASLQPAGRVPLGRTFSSKSALVEALCLDRELELAGVPEEARAAVAAFVEPQASVADARAGYEVLQGELERAAALVAPLRKDGEPETAAIALLVWSVDGARDWIAGKLASDPAWAGEGAEVVVTPVETALIGVLDDKDSTQRFAAAKLPLTGFLRLRDGIAAARRASLRRDRAAADDGERVRKVIGLGDVGQGASPRPFDTRFLGDVIAHARGRR